METEIRRRRQQRPSTRGAVKPASGCRHPRRSNARRRKRRSSPQEDRNTGRAARRVCAHAGRSQSRNTEGWSGQHLGRRRRHSHQRRSGIHSSAEPDPQCGQRDRPRSRHARGTSPETATARAPPSSSEACGSIAGRETAAAPARQESFNWRRNASDRGTRPFDPLTERADENILNLGGSDGISAALLAPPRQSGFGIRGRTGLSCREPTPRLARRARRERGQAKRRPRFPSRRQSRRGPPRRPHLLSPR